jgi:hypothetical protein
MSLEFENGSTKGYAYLAPSSSAERYRPSPKIKETGVPAKVDLRQYMTTVENQQQLSSCTANAGASSAAGSRNTPKL